MLSDSGEVRALSDVMLSHGIAQLKHEGCADVGAVYRANYAFHITGHHVATGKAMSLVGAYSPIGSEDGLFKTVPFFDAEGMDVARAVLLDSFKPETHADIIEVCAYEKE